MKKLFSTIAVCMAMVSVPALVSCGGSDAKSDYVTVTPAVKTFEGAVEVVGDQAKYISVEEGSYAMDSTYVGYKITIKVKLNEAIGQEIEDLSTWELGIFDAEDHLATTFYLDGVSGNAHDYESTVAQELKKFLETGQAGETKEFTFVSGELSKYRLEELKTGAKLKLGVEFKTAKDVEAAKAKLEQEAKAAEAAAEAAAQEAAETDEAATDEVSADEY